MRLSLGSVLRRIHHIYTANRAAATSSTVIAIENSLRAMIFVFLRYLCKGIIFRQINMQLFYAPGIVPPRHTLTEEESRHCIKVLRMKQGDRIHITDGRGNLHTAEVSKADPRGCVVEVVETVREYGRRGYRLTMAVAPTKNTDRYEWFLEKATEVGVDAVIPIECGNSERRTLKPDRPEKVIASAAKQSLKAYMPVLEPMTPVREVITRPFDGAKFIAHCRPETVRTDIMEAIPAGTDILVLIGPEGDFTAEEVGLALVNGFTAVSLGQSRLRTETAALAAVMAAYFINQ